MRHQCTRVGEFLKRDSVMLSALMWGKRLMLVSLSIVSASLCCSGALTSASHMDFCAVYCATEEHLDAKVGTEPNSRTHQLITLYIHWRGGPVYKIR